MSNIYIQEPPTTGKVLLITSVGDVEIELWTKEAPKACRNFIQLCTDNYYENTIFHRVVKGFIVQGGDPTGTGLGGESIYGQPFKDEFHTRLRFCRRGLVAMANAGKDDNTSQFFFTLAATPELQNKHTIFGKIVGDTIYNVLKLEETEIDQNERPIYPQRIIKAEILLNPFEDLVPRTQQKTEDANKEPKKRKKSGVKNFKLLSFGEEAEEDEEESTVLNRQFSGKSKSAHDNLEDPKLSKETVVSGGPSNKKLKEDRSSDWESDGNNETEEDKIHKKKTAAEMKRRIIDKLREKKSSETIKKREINYVEATEKELEDEKVKNNKPVIEDEEEKGEEEEEYYLGKDRHDEKKRQAEAIRKEIKELKRGVQKEKKAKEAVAKKEEEKNTVKENDAMVEFIETQKKYKEALERVPKKGASREDFTLAMLKKFQSKIQKAKESSEKTNDNDSNGVNYDNDDVDDESWMTHTLYCEEKDKVLAKDANMKDDDWFEIYDPRNPINKRRRGEKSEKKKLRRDHPQYK